MISKALQFDVVWCNGYLSTWKQFDICSKKIYEEIHPSWVSFLEMLLLKDPWKSLINKSITQIKVNNTCYGLS